MNKLLIYSIALFFINSVYAQKYKSDKSAVTFYSVAPIENIESTNIKSQSMLDISNQNIVFSIPIDGFELEKALMQEHFNEKYMETEKFPKSTFSGKFDGFDINKEGNQEVKAKGKLTIHGVTKTIKVSGNMKFEENRIVLTCTFKVKLDDYEIARPQVLWQNIAEVVDVKLLFEYAKTD